jgi:hypothetical protein
MNTTSITKKISSIELISIVKSLKYFFYYIPAIFKP